ncbi:MAG: response regulator transcription factor, partial [Ekhidna sp.]|nr:response regulator transcription factor [Ekhidna sp.]
MIVDDHDMVRQGIESIIKTDDELLITMAANSGMEALDMLDKAETLPHIILMDIFMPEMNGLVTATKVKEKFPEIKIIILSMEISSEYIK